MKKEARQRTKILVFALALASLTLSASPSHAVIQVAGDETTNLKIGGLFQFWMTTTEDNAPGGDSWDTDFYIRRMRLIFLGQINDHFNYFIETDNANLGKNGDFTPRMFIQDAYLEFVAHKQYLMIDAGMIIAPFSHHTMQGAITPMALEYHTGVIRFAPDTHFVWRDFGVQFRGAPIKKWLDLRLAITNGAHGNGEAIERGGEAGEPIWLAPDDPRNPDDWPRISGRLTFNILDSEFGPGIGGMYYNGPYIKRTENGTVSTKRILSVGFGMDWQKDLNAYWKAMPASGGTRGVKYEDYMGIAGDVFFDLPFGVSKNFAFNGQFNFYYFDHGDRTDTSNSYYNSIGEGRAYTGYGFISELGFRAFFFQPCISFDMYESTKAEGDLGDHLAVYGGLNFYFYAHQASLKLRFGGESFNGDDMGLSGALQTQLYF